MGELDVVDKGKGDSVRRARHEKEREREMGKEDGDEGERRGAERREGMEERGFIEAAGKSSAIAL